MPGYLPRYRPEPTPKLTDMALEPKPANQTKAADWQQADKTEQNFKSWFNLLG